MNKSDECIRGKTYTIGENTRESRSDATKEIEDRVSLSNLIYGL